MGVDPADAVDLVSLVADYAARLTIARAPDTRTSPAISAKNLAKKALVARCRKVARIVQAHPATTAADRAALGLRERDVAPTPHRRPATRPTIHASAIGACRTMIRLADSESTSRAARPRGIIGALIWTRIGDDAPRDPGECTFAGLATRAIHRIEHPAEARNKSVWILAQWVNEKGDAGPVSNAAWASIAA